MASLAESSLASVPINGLAALQSHLLNHREQLEASAPQIVPEAANDDLANNAHRDGGAVSPNSADAYRTPKPSSPRAHTPRRLSTKSAPPADTEMNLHPSPAQEAFKAMARAESFHGFPGGDTQPMDSQVYRNYTESMALAKSTIITPKKSSPGGKQDTYGTTATGRTPHTYVEGETGFIDLEAAWQHDSPTARSTTSGIDELLASPQTELQVAELTQRRIMPETPVMAGHKRRSSGEMVSSATGETKKTPGFSQLFGAVPKSAVFSATQLFGQTQAPSSPVPDAPRSDPVMTRPSPNMNERFTVSSPQASRSSPVMTMHGRPATFSGEPRVMYTSIQESDERRREREEEEQQHRRMERIDEDDFDLEDNGELPQRQQRHNIRTRRVMSDEMLGKRSRMMESTRPWSRPGSNRKQTAMIDLVTPATVRHGGERHGFDDLEDSDEDMAVEDEDVQKPEVDEADGNDVYDELAQTVLRSQPNDVEDDDEGEEDHHNSDDEGAPDDDVTGVEMDVPGKDKGLEEGRGHQGAMRASPEPEKSITATQRSAVADSQPFQQEQRRSVPTMSQLGTSAKSSFVPGSQYAGQTSVDQAILHSSKSRRPAELRPHSGEPLERVPSSPPVPNLGSTLPEGSAEASLARRQVLAQFQRPPVVERKYAADDMEVPESDALMSEEVRPDTAQSAIPDRMSLVGESNSVAVPYSTARTHLSASGPSPAKENLGVERSPLKMLATQHSGLSADSPRKLAGVRRFADIAADASPPDPMEDTAVDVDAIMSDVMTAADHDFINAMSSPVTKPSKRRKLTHKASGKSRSEGGSVGLEVEDPVVRGVPAQPDRPLPTPPGATAEEPSAEHASTVLRSSPSKGNELPISTPQNMDTPKSTQESTKKRERAGAAAVSHLLAARAAKPARLTKLAGRGRKAASVVERESNSRAALRKLEVETKQSSVKLVGREGERDRSAVRDDENGVTEAQQPVVEYTTKGAAEPPHAVAEEPQADQADGATPLIAAPHRIFALFKGSFNNFYPATWLSTSGDGKSYKVRFDDTTETFIDASHARSLDLRVGDHVKVDHKNMRKQVWTIRGFGEPAQTDAEGALGTNIQGHHIAKVQLRSSRKSLPANHQALQDDSDMVDVLISNIYITHSLWPAFVERPFIPPDAAGVNHSRLATPTTGLQTPDTETPGSRSRRKLVPTTNIARRISHLREESIASGSSRSDADIFAGMAFAISYGANNAERADVTRSILGNGGIILEGGFDELFEQPNLDDEDDEKKANGIERAGLVLKPKYRDLGFVALIADRHSRRAKYMQALALGLPTLSGRWIADSLAAVNGPQAEATAPLAWSKYLLAAGESSYLNGAVRSRTIALTPSAGETKLVNTIEQRSKLLGGDGVLILASTKQKANWDRRKTYAFLTLALGAGYVKRVTDYGEAKRLLGAEGGEGWKWVYVDGSVGEASAALFGAGSAAAASGKKRKRGGEATPKVEKNAMAAVSADGRVKVINDEFVVQSLILGALVEQGCLRAWRDLA
ncbi:radiation sensitive protein rad9 [Friedmanniomyces endolithicus]|nr:radiation sensitive protein rad9 [Friedmanniomyces endolithicus]KAK0789134.1 radiation sensitive protein rad9 [Friedmanniomyces endolithicus]KAK0799051.1 radiation sensitive protein rad9 [Friedmanniomyces endolithicus]KAK0801743.1 radiation sensitive protein rad9 [Friedmanniomyces endolithicus]KAK0842477.1 radiation sensitive protein rad9 [Friedmanniomyces endolithicus]